MRGVYSKGFLFAVILAVLALSRGSVLAQRFVVFTISSQTWKYNTNNLDGSGWKMSAYNDSAASWKSGKGLFGLETTPDRYLPFTFVTPIPPPNQGGPPATYFRRPRPRESRRC